MCKEKGVRGGGGWGGGEGLAAAVTRPPPALPLLQQPVELPKGFGNATNFVFSDEAVLPRKYLPQPTASQGGGGGAAPSRL